MKRRNSGSSRRVHQVEGMSSAQWYYTGGEMEGSKTVQQLLRPTDTCTFVVQGYLLGLQNPAERLFAIVKHEGSNEHALFMFTIDDMESPPQLVLDRFCAIRGSFQAQIKAVRGGRCNVLLDDGTGSSMMLQLLYSTSIASLFISNLNQALQQFAYSPSVNSPLAFGWLSGYEACRTGWDRFSKPGNSRIQKSGSPAPLIEFGKDHYENGREGAQKQQPRLALPENWPWSHIITPNSDGTTEVAKCESLLQDFDPLHQPEPPRQPQGTSQSQTQFPPQEPVSIEITGASFKDDSNFCQLPPRPFQTSNPSPPVIGFEDDFNPVLPITTPSPSLSDPGAVSASPDLRHCTSDSNLLKLGKRYQTRSCDKMDPLVTRSEEDLTSVDVQGHGNRHCIAMSRDPEASPLEGSGSDFCLIDVGSVSPDVDVGRPLDRGDDADTDGRSGQTRRDHPINKHLAKVIANAEEPYSSADMANSSDEEDTLDYKNRRARSTDTSPSMNDLRKVQANFPKKHFDFLAPSGSKPGVSKVIVNSPELTRRRRARSRDRAGSRAPTTLSRNPWVSRYRPGVPIPTESARESIMQAELRHREKEFCKFRELRVFCGTWNVNGRHAPTTLEQFLLEYEVEGEELPVPTPDIFAVAFQELDLSTQVLMGQESTREEPWTNAVEKTISMVGKYLKLCSIRLVGMLLLLYIKEGLQKYVTDVMADMVPTGMGGLFGNKGAVAVHFNMFHSSLCFVNSHLPAHLEEVDRRNQDYHAIQSKMVFDRGTDYAYGIMDHDMVFWIGDLNYRIQITPEMTPDIVKSYADNFQISRLLKYDQLQQEIAKGNVFMFFTEGDINFKPSYKYDVNSDEWDTSEKSRPPAWCDRILQHGSGLKLRAYRSHPKLKISDHKPVSAVFDTTMCVVIPEKEKEVLEQITWHLDKLENDTLPQVDLSTTEFQFEDVMFMTPQSKRLVVTNTGQRPVHVSFIPKLDDKAYCQPWLDVKPSSAVIQPLEDVAIQVTVLVNEDTALALSKADHQLQDILILHLEKGKDFFISVSGNYLLSCFGSSLETLIHLHTYIREVPVATLLDLTQSLTSSWDETITTDDADTPKPVPPPLDIPKELYQMVDYIKRNGLETEGLFSEGGRQWELEAIRDHLDTGRPSFPKSVSSVATGLLLFLAALAEPVVPESLHQRAMDCCNNATLCKQILMQMPTVHRRTFAFLITLMKNLLQHSEVNGLEPKVLATIFGDALLRHTREDRKTKSKKQLTSMNRKKATFIYQFLVNDLIISYK